MAKALGKWAALLTLLPYVGAWAAKHWPEHSDLITLALNLAKQWGVGQ